MLLFSTDAGFHYAGDGKVHNGTGLSVVQTNQCAGCVIVWLQ